MCLISIIIFIQFLWSSLNSQPVSLSWKWMDPDCSDEDPIAKFNNLFVVEGRQIFDFLQTTVLKKLSPISQIDGYKTSMYKLPETGDYLCITEDNNLDEASQMTELLSPWLSKAEKTHIFTFQSAYTYNTKQEFDKRCFIRTISNLPTKTTNEFDFIAPMEDCNIVSGVSAGGLFTHSENSIEINIIQ